MPFDAYRPILIAVSRSASDNSRHAPPRRCAGLAGRAHGDERGSGTSLVFLHGLTFDHRMGDPVLDAPPSAHRAIALDLPGHGSSAALPQHGQAAVAEAIHEAVLDLGLDTPSSLDTQTAARSPRSTPRSTRPRRSSRSARRCAWSHSLSS